MLPSPACKSQNSFSYEWKPQRAAGMKWLKAGQLHEKEEKGSGRWLGGSCFSLWVILGGNTELPRGRLVVEKVEAVVQTPESCPASLHFTVNMRSPADTSTSEMNEDAVCVLCVYSVCVYARCTVCSVCLLCEHCVYSMCVYAVCTLCVYRMSGTVVAWLCYYGYCSLMVYFLFHPVVWILTHK